MRGYTKEQLKSKGAKLTNYIFCDNCKLYWHKRIFEKHLRPPTKTRRIEIMSPAFEEFIDFLAEAAVKQWQAEVANGTYKPEPTKNAKAARVKKSNPKRAPSDHDELLTVDEAAARFGLSREEILARSEPIWEPFEVFIPSESRARRKRSK